MKRSITPVLFFITILFCATSAFALTASIGNAKMILNADVIEGTPTYVEKELIINNVNDIAVKVHMNAINDLEYITRIIDNDFILQPGEKKLARFRVRLDYGGNYDGMINIGFVPGEQTFGGAGVGLSSHIIIFATGPENPDKTAIPDWYEEEIGQYLPKDIETQNNVQEDNVQEEEQKGDSAIGKLAYKFGFRIAGDDAPATATAPKRSNKGPLIALVIGIIAIIIGILIWLMMRL